MWWTVLICLAALYVYAFVVVESWRWVARRSQPRPPSPSDPKRV